MAVNSETSILKLITQRHMPTLRNVIVTLYPSILKAGKAGIL